MLLQALMEDMKECHGLNSFCIATRMCHEGVQQFIMAAGKHTYHFHGTVQFNTMQLSIDFTAQHKTALFAQPCTASQHSNAQLDSTAQHSTAAMLFI